MPKARKLKVKKTTTAKAPAKSNPKPKPVKSEMSDAGRALRALGGAGAGALGTFFGVPPSMTVPLGTMAGGAVSRLLGQGDYEVSTNSLIAPGSSHLNSATVVMGPDGRRGIRIQEREFIANVTGTTSFVNKAYLINPANAATFPWLSTVAQNFDEWRPNGIAFSFKSTSAAFNGTNQALGVVIGATDYDALDPSYPTKLEMQSSAYCVSAKASEDFIHLIECDPDERGREVMKCLSGDLGPTGSSLMDYVLGKFQVATEGQSTTGQVLGELWVSYDITFFKKQLAGGQVGNGLYNAYISWNAPAGFTSATPFSGVAPNDGSFGNMDISFNLAGTKLRFNGISAGSYYIEFNLSCSAAASASTAATWQYLSNCKVWPVTYTGNAAFGFTTYGSNISRYATSTYLAVTGPNPVVGLDISNFSGSGVTFIGLRILQINGQFNLPAITCPHTEVF